MGKVNDEMEAIEQEESLAAAEPNTTNRLKILQQSLRKKESLFDVKLKVHFDTVKQANGQPLNDKRNGRATLNKWDRQSDSLRALQNSIEKTKAAIKHEEGKIYAVEFSKEYLPPQILVLVESGELIQWRKHPNRFFVPGVDKARIIWDEKDKVLAHQYTKEITDKEQWKKFVQTFNSLKDAIKHHMPTLKSV
jgi:hypothetical protein